MEGGVGVMVIYGQQDLVGLDSVGGSELRARGRDHRSSKAESYRGLRPYKGVSAAPEGL